MNIGINSRLTLLSKEVQNTILSPTINILGMSPIFNKTLFLFCSFRRVHNENNY